jgi:hypothetical protein
MSNQQPNISNGTKDMPSTGSVQENPMNDIRDGDYFAGQHLNNDVDDEAEPNDEEKKETSNDID